MQRRDLLIAAGGALGAGGLAGGQGWLDAAPVKTSRARSSAPAVIVVGAGAMGGWTALHLAEAGANVTLVDAYGAGNLRSASSGETRLLRADYVNPLYARMALASYAELLTRQAAWNENLLVPTGQLLLAGADKALEVDRLQATLAAVGVEGVERLSRDDLQRRWPQIAYAGIETALFTPGGPGATTVHARRTTLRAAKAFVEAGGRVVLGQAKAPSSGQSGISVPLSSGETLTGDVAVYACGAWMPRLFPDIIGPHVRVQRRDVFFFGTPAGDARFSHPQLPAWVFLGAGFYGFPDLDGSGFKVGPHPDLNPIDPDTDDRRPNAYVAERAERFLRERFPGLAGQPLVSSRVCQVGVTGSDDFIADRHPGMADVWLIGGDSGHAFKHGPAMGRDMARRILRGGGDPAYAEAFKLPA